MWFNKHLIENDEKSSYTCNDELEGDKNLKIALCDDESIHRDTLKEALTVCGALPQETIITEFSNGKSLLEKHIECSHDIVFLDIEMEGLSGLETGQKLRDIDRNVIIIYLTSYKKYVFKSFKIEPFDYILKPINNSKICEVLTRAIKKHREQFYIVDFSWYDKSYTLKACDIVHIESDIRHVTFVTDNNKYKSVGKLDDYEKRLSPYGFLRCHQSFLINMNYVKSIESKSIITTLGGEIDMSARRKQDCLNAFNEFITRYKV
ncbi:MAG: LytTR family DNA-binding domain-containing protein [Oscillospiraceae bacterium]|nr:LytTR family DNA-binding domain-containing protein [Oscillospiraceae bacterium]